MTKDLHQTHWLKLHFGYFEATKCGAKPFEVRRDDRGFQKGDTLVLSKWGKDIDGVEGYMDQGGRVVSAHPDGAQVAVTRKWVTYVLTGAQFGLAGGFVVLGLMDPE